MKLPDFIKAENNILIVLDNECQSTILSTNIPIDVKILKVDPFNDWINLKCLQDKLSMFVVGLPISQYGRRWTAYEVV